MMYSRRPPAGHRGRVEMTQPSDDGSARSCASISASESAVRPDWANPATWRSVMAAVICRAGFFRILGKNRSRTATASGAPEELIAKLEDNIFMMDQLTTILDEDGADAIIPQVMRGLEPEIVLRHPMAYRCACSRARVEQALRQCGAQELQDMIAEGKDTQVHCQFCDAEYVFTPAQLQTLLDAENADAAAD